MSKRVVFEYGILGHMQDDGSVDLAETHWSESFSSLAAVHNKHGIRPLALFENSPLRGETIAFYGWSPNRLRAEPRHLLMQNFEDIIERLVLSSRLDAETDHEEALGRAAETLGHRLAAVRYHLERLTTMYVELARVGANWQDEESDLPYGLGAIEPLDWTKEQVLAYLPAKLGWAGDVAGTNLRTHQLSGGPSDQVFFEEQSFLSAARIVLDRLQPLLSLERWAKRKSLPRSFPKLVAAARAHAPRRLEATLSARYAGWGQSLIAYRDCVEHFAELAPDGMLETEGIFNDEGYIASFCLLPDNPEARSSAEFTFDLGIDCLEYSCRTYCDLLWLVLDVLTHAREDVRIARRQRERRRATRSNPR